MIRRSALAFLFLSITFFTACSDSGSGDQPYYGGRSIATVEEVLARMPARSVERGEQVFAALVNLGPRNIRRICDRLVPPGTGDDTRERLALSGLAKYVTRPGAESERKMVSRVFVDALKSVENVEVISFLIRQLQLAGKDEAVTPLSRYLSDERLCGPAAQALVTIGTPGAGKAFLKVLPEVSGSNRVTLIQALGQLRSKAAVKTLLEHTAADDPDTRQVALYALANIGDPAAAEVLAEAARTDSASKGVQAASPGGIHSDNYVLFAQRLAEGGRKRQCVAICRELLASPLEYNARAAALSTLVTVLGGDALDDLLNAMDTGNAQLQGAALALADRIPGRRATGRWVARLEKAQPEVQAKIVTMLGRRGDSAALRAVQQALKDADPGVRLAAIPALVRLAGDDAAGDFIEAFQVADQPAEVAALKEALLRLPDRTILTVVAQALSEAPSAAQITLLEILAERGGEDQLETVFKHTRARDEGVRLAAIDALGYLGGEGDMPRLLDLLLKARGDGERAAAQRAAVTVANRIPDPERRSDHVLALLDKTTGEQRAHLLRVLGRIGGSRALENIRKATRSNDPVLKDAAIRALANWPDVSAADDLLDIIRGSDDLTHQVLALRGYVNIIDTADLPPGKKIRYLKDALAVVRRPEDKKLIISGLGKVPALESLKLMSAYLNDEDLQAEAAFAVVNIAQGLSGSEVAMGLIGTLVDQEVGTQIQRYLTTVAAEPGARRSARGFVPLFNGRDLMGWKVSLDIPVTDSLTGAHPNVPERDPSGRSLWDWQVVEGELVVDSAGAGLVTEKDYGDSSCWWTGRSRQAAGAVSCCGVGLRCRSGTRTSIPRAPAAYPAARRGRANPLCGPIIPLGNGTLFALS